MMNPFKKARPEGWLILLGAVLMLAATILHPPLVDPYDLQKAYHEFKHAQFWIGDHILMLIAISLWLAGLAASKAYMARNNKTSDFGAGMMFVALAAWNIDPCLRINHSPDSRQQRHRCQSVGSGFFLRAFVRLFRFCLQLDRHFLLRHGDETVRRHFSEMVFCFCPVVRPARLFWHYHHVPAF